MSSIVAKMMTIKRERCSFLADAVTLLTIIAAPCPVVTALSLICYFFVKSHHRAIYYLEPLAIKETDGL